MRILAFDFGASSGRAMLGEFQNGLLKIKEIHRFVNEPIQLQNTIYWDIQALYQQILTGMKKAVADGGFDSIGIDTWGIDFGLIDGEGNLIRNPIHYRDERTTGIMEQVFEMIPKDVIYQKTGIQFMRFNTLFQLFYMAQKEAEILKNVKKILLIPDLFNYFLTGKMHTEYTNATTTQCINAKTCEWDLDLLAPLGIPKNILTDIIPSGQIYGTLKQELAEQLNCGTVPIVSVASHDTASAIAAVPSEQDDFIYISCGTWSLFGTELKEPIINETSFGFNLTNEGGHNNTFAFLKNIMGLWLIQESRRQLKREGTDISFAELEAQAMKAKPFACMIDPDSPEFELMGDLPSKVKEFCRRTGQSVPQTTGEIIRCINESLAMKYRYTLEQIRQTTGKEYQQIHMIGGGTQSKLLCQMTADVCGMTVKAGPIEATVIGNIIVQLMALGKIKDVKEARKIVANSFPVQTYQPDKSSKIENHYKAFVQMIHKK